MANTRELLKSFNFTIHLDLNIEKATEPFTE